jgi:hypothetical protein
MPARPIDPEVQRARAEAKNFLGKVTGFTDICRTYRRPSDRRPFGRTITITARGFFRDPLDGREGDIFIDVVATT